MREVKRDNMKQGRDNNKAGAKAHCLTWFESKAKTFVVHRSV
jgi:hypothetical protein